MQRQGLNTKDINIPRQITSKEKKEPFKFEQSKQ